MKVKLNFLTVVISIVILHSLAFSFSLLSVSSFSEIPVAALIVSLVAIILSLFIGFIAHKRNKDGIKALKERAQLLASDELVELPEISLKQRDFVAVNESIEQSNEKIKKMYHFISKLTDHVNKQTNLLKEHVGGLAENSTHITTTMEEISSGAEEQANSASSLTETVQQFTNTIMTVAINGENIKEESKSMLSITDEGTQLMSQSIDKMKIIDDTINQSLQRVRSLDDMTLKITQLVTVIQEVAEQTNLLALNAAIEAARAGEHGKGFAVVADEVRKLAEQVSLSINDITESTNGIQEESKTAVQVLEKGYQAVNEGSEQIKTTGVTFNKLNEIITNMGKEIEGVANSLYDVLDNSKTINDSISNIASVSEESAAGILEAESAAERLDESIAAINGEQKEFEKAISELYI